MKILILALNPRAVQETARQRAGWSVRSVAWLSKADADWADVVIGWKPRMKIARPYLCAARWLPRLTPAERERYTSGSGKLSVAQIKELVKNMHSEIVDGNCWCTCTPSHECEAHRA